VPVRKKVVVCGMGSMGKNHHRIYEQNRDMFDLVGYFDPNVKGSLTEREFNSVLKELDGLSICAPSSLHTQLAAQALSTNSKIKVLVEKPIDSSIESAREFNSFLCKNERSNDVLVGHIERFNPAVNRLKSIIETDAGNPISIRTKRFGNVASREIKNVSIDLIVHDIDICRYVLGPKCQYTSSRLVDTRKNESDVVDSSCLTAVFRSGNRDVSIVCEANWITPIKIRTLEINTENYYLTLEYSSQKLYGYDVMGQPVDFSAARSEPLFNELKHFYDMMTIQVAPACRASDAIFALEMASGHHST